MTAYIANHGHFLRGWLAFCKQHAKSIYPLNKSRGSLTVKPLSGILG